MRFTKREVALAVALLSSGVFAAPMSNFEARAPGSPVQLAKPVSGGIQNIDSGGGNNAGSSLPPTDTKGQQEVSDTDKPAGFSEQVAGLKPSEQKR